MRGIRDIGAVMRASSKMEQLTAAKALIQKLEKQAVISDSEWEKFEAMGEEVLMKHTDQPDEQRVLYDLQYRAENLRNKRFVEHTRSSPMLDYEHGHKPHRRWNVDFEVNRPGRYAHSFNNALLRLLCAVRQDKAEDGCYRHAPDIQLEVEAGTPLILAHHKIGLQKVLADVPEFRGILAQGSVQRGTSIEDWGGFEWGSATSSDLDFVVLFGAEATADNLCRLKDMLGAQSEKSSLKPGRYGLQVDLPLQEGASISVDIIPAVADPQGGHWIWDSVKRQLLHNNPGAMAEHVREAIRRNVGLADVVVLCKFWNKRKAVKCDDGQKRAPFTSNHLELLLAQLPGPLPTRLDEAFLQALGHLRRNLLQTTVPEHWTGKPAEEYLRHDSKRCANTRSLLKRQEACLQKVLSSDSADPVAWSEVLGDAGWLADPPGAFLDDEEARVDYVSEKRNRKPKL